MVRVGSKKEEDDESAVLPSSVHDTDGAFQRSVATFWIEDHSSNTVCAIGVSAPSLQRESTDSLRSPQMYG